MSFTKITPEDLRSRGCTTLPDRPTISAQALKEEFDAPAKEIVAPKFNKLIDDLGESAAASDIGAVPPTGLSGNNVQAVLNSLATASDPTSYWTASTTDITAGTTALATNHLYFVYE